MGQAAFAHLSRAVRVQDEHGNFPDWGKESGTASLGSSSPPIMLGGGPLRSYNNYSVSDTVNVVGARFGS